MLIHNFRQARSSRGTLASYFIRLGLAETARAPTRSFAFSTRASGQSEGAQLSWGFRKLLLPGGSGSWITGSILFSLAKLLFTDAIVDTRRPQSSQGKYHRFHGIPSTNIMNTTSSKHLIPVVRSRRGFQIYEPYVFQNCGLVLPSLEQTIVRYITVDCFSIYRICHEDFGTWI